MPAECAGYITGRNGQSLRSIGNNNFFFCWKKLKTQLVEEETGTLMFFCRRRGAPSPERDGW